MRYEIALAESLGIPELGLYDSRSGNPISAMIGGNPRIPAVRYGSLADLWPMLDPVLVKAGYKPVSPADLDGGQHFT